MYKPHYRGRQNNHRRSFNGGRRMKTFDPTAFIQKATEPVEEEVFEPNYAFADFEIANQVKQNIMSRGYKDPTPIQDQVIPVILKGRDVVGIANTGTGKTAAFLIPLINKVYCDKTQRVLIIAPTRELAVQIEHELYSFTKNMGINSVICIGGVSIKGQINSLRGNPHFVIGTPGRLLDLESQRKLNFRNYASIVLDEVDRMLDMGFINDMEKIIAKLPRPRQSLFFSATMTGSVQSVMSRFINDPVMISVKKQDNLANVDQDVIKINGKSKTDVLIDLLDNREFQKVLVFGRTKHGIEKLNRELNRARIYSVSIHGNKTQNQRQKALELFRSGRVSVLLGTDVASRGIDVDGITHVINYDLPETYEDYIHRIGRTGRANKKGCAITFVV